LNERVENGNSAAITMQTQIRLISLWIYALQQSIAPEMGDEHSAADFFWATSYVELFQEKAFQ
jgi:hypothetical protein